MHNLQISDLNPTLNLTLAQNPTLT